MKNTILKAILAFFIFYCSLFIAESETWQECMDSSYYYQNNLNYITALQYARKAIILSEKSVGVNDTNYAIVAGRIPELLFYTGRRDSAIIIGEEHLSFCRKIFNKNNANLATFISNLAYFYKSDGQYEKAEPLYLEALEIFRNIYTSDHPSLASTINNLAAYYRALDNYSKAEPLYLEALDIYRRLYKNDNIDLAASINNIGLFYHIIGNFEKAKEYYKESLAMLRRICEKNDPRVANTINNLANVILATGENSKAEPLFLEALEMYRQFYKSDNTDFARSINSVGYYYKSVGNYRKAEPLYKEALAMRRRLFTNDHTDLARSINNMGSFYENVGNYEKAEQFFEESLAMTRKIYKTDHFELANRINNLGSLLSDIGNYKKAEPLLKEALAMRRRLFSSDNRDLVNSISNLAVFYRRLGKNDLAEPLFLEANEMSNRLFPNDHPTLASTINNLAVFYYMAKNFEKAGPLLKEQLAMKHRLYNSVHPALADGIFNYATFLEETNQLKEAERLYFELLENNKKMLEDVFPILSEVEKKHYWNAMNPNFEGFNSLALKRIDENPLILCNMYDNQLFTKAILFNTSNRIKTRIINSNDSSLIFKLNEWSDKRDFLVSLYKMSNEELKNKNLNIDSIENVANDLEKELSLKSEDFKQSYEKKKVTWRSIQTLLKPDEAAVEAVRFRYWDNRRFTDTVYYAFLVLTEKTSEHPDLLVLENGQQLENEYFSDYRDNIKRRTKDTISYIRYWEKLHDKLKGYKKIYFSADGVYNKLNPETLLMPNGKYLIEEKDIQQMNSTKDLLIGYNNNRKDVDHYESAVLIGNPNFTLSESIVNETSNKIRRQLTDEANYETLTSIRGINLTSLPGTEKEVKDIEKLLKNKNIKVETYLGDMALKTVVKTVSNPGILHIATHGMFLQDVKKESTSILGFDEQKIVENPLLRSGLFFTGADNYLKSDSVKPSGDDNGLLTAYEAMNLELDKTELVVLSACETGLGEVVNGEGVYGLRRAFQQAGAHSIIMSLWTVNDEATQELMTKFYSNWVSGMAKREAFKKAQIEIKSKYKDPYFWGAFVMVGE